MALTKHVHAAAALALGAIAGIDSINAAAVIAAGADGVAVIRALFGAESVEGRARDLRARIDAALGERRGQP